ncbi:hypothetical protein SprV_0301173700 [Sparganum proliferum]
MIFARILLNRLNHHLEQGLLPESQCGFRRHRGTADLIFTARQLQEKCQVVRTHLYSTFVDLTKAFDTVIREGHRKGHRPIRRRLRQLQPLHQHGENGGYASTRGCLRRCGAQQRVVDNFTCLGSTLSRTTKIDDEVARRITKASPAFGRLQITEV